MKTQNKKHIAAIIAVLTIGALNTSVVQAESTAENSGLIYNNRAYTPAIQSYPNTVADHKAESAEIIYVSNASGPAIYSYPSSIPFQTTRFNVEYVSTAYGPVIYSYYPNNNVQHQHRLNLVKNENTSDNRFITPVALKLNDNPVKAAGSGVVSNGL